MGAAHLSCPRLTSPRSLGGLDPLPLPVLASLRSSIRQRRRSIRRRRRSIRQWRCSIRSRLHPAAALELAAAGLDLAAPAMAHASTRAGKTLCLCRRADLGKSADNQGQEAVHEDAGSLNSNILGLGRSRLRRHKEFSSEDLDGSGSYVAVVATCPDGLQTSVAGDGL